MAFAEGRRNSCRDFGDIQIVMRTSRNDGKTWSPLRIVASNGKLQADNAVPIVDTLDPKYPKGRIFLIYATGDAPESSVRNGQGTRRIWYRTTVDDGAMWDLPVEITAEVKLPSWRNYSIGPGHGLQFTNGPHKGRLLVAAYHSEGAPQSAYRDSHAHTFFSDDHGRTWSLGATVDWPGSNESTAAQSSAGTVVLNSRDQSGDSHARILSISTDGSTHWDSTFIAHDLPDPVCEGSMLNYTLPDGRSTLLFSNSSSNIRDDRRDLTISASLDGGKTWPKHTILYPGPAAYSDLVIIHKNQLDILWERGDEGGIVFLTYPIHSLLTPDSNDEVLPKSPMR